MPTDKSGRFHGNIQRAMAADKNPPPTPKKAPRAMAPVLEPDGDEGGPAQHLKAFHDAMGGGKAMIAHSDGINLTSHQIGEDGEVESHDHANLEELKASMDQFLDEEGAGGPSAELGMARGDVKDVY